MSQRGVRARQPERQARANGFTMDLSIRFRILDWSVHISISDKFLNPLLTLVSAALVLYGSHHVLN